MYESSRGAMDHGYVRELQSVHSSTSPNERVAAFEGKLNQERSFDAAWMNLANLKARIADGKFVHLAMLYSPIPHGAQLNSLHRRLCRCFYSAHLTLDPYRASPLTIARIYSTHGSRCDCSHLREPGYRLGRRHLEIAIRIASGTRVHAQLQYSWPEGGGICTPPPSLTACRD